MDCTSEEDSDVSVFELEDYGDQCYEEIKNGKLKVKISEGVFRCPICQGKWKPNFTYNDLLQHASEVAKGSHRNIKLRANHLALAKYLERDLTQPTVENEPTNKHDRDEVFVFPWIGIVVNIKTEYHNGKYVGESGFGLRDQLTKKGFNPVRVTPLWNYRGHSGTAIVEFHKEWPGLHNAISFEKALEEDMHGKRDWRANKHSRSSIYGWVARDDDYNSGDIIGKHLCKNRGLNLKTIAEIVAIEEQKTVKLVTKLLNEIEVKNQQFKEIECKFNETNLALQILMDEDDRLHQTHNEEKKKMQMNARDLFRNARDHFQKIFLENEKLMSELDIRRKALEQRRKSELEVQACIKDYFLQKTTMEQKKADKNVSRRAEEQREKDNLYKRILELEKQLSDKQDLEQDIERLKGNLKVIKQLRVEDDIEVKKKTDEMNKNLKEKEDELEDLEALNLVLTVKERKSNDELQEARNKLIDALKQNSGRSLIGVRRMGELDSVAFKVAGKRKYIREDADEKSIEICSLWEELLRDSSWHPFKIVKVGDNHEEIINEHDEKLSDLRREWGEEVYEAVTTALMEMNKYNASGRYPTPDLWNYREGKRATISDGISYILRQKKRR